MNIIEKTSIAKKAFYSLGIFCATGFIVFMMGIFIGNLPNRNSGLATIFIIGGYLLIAAPMMMTFLFKVGIFVEVGPLFSYSDVPIGNFIYRTVSRDYSSQAAIGIGFTLIKIFLIFFVSLFLTPIITLAVYLCYKKIRKNALKYAQDNGIDEKSVPSVNKKVVCAVLLLVVVLFIGAIIGSAVSGAQTEKETAENNTEYEELFNEIKASLPIEYYAIGYKGVNPSGGAIAEFFIDNEKVTYGEIANDFSSDIEGLYSGSEYYIIDDKVYLDSSSIGTFELDNNEAVREYLLGRRLSSWIGEDAKYKNYVSFASEGKVSLVFESGTKEYGLMIDDNDKILELSIHKSESDNDIESIFKMDNSFDLTEIKEKAQELIDSI